MLMVYLSCLSVYVFWTAPGMEEVDVGEVWILQLWRCQCLHQFSGRPQGPWLLAKWGYVDGNWKMAKFWKATVSSWNTCIDCVYIYIYLLYMYLYTYIYIHDTIPDVCSTQTTRSHKVRQRKYDIYIYIFFYTTVHCFYLNLVRWRYAIDGTSD